MKCLCDSPAGTKIIADLRQDKELDLQEGSVHRFLHIAQDNFYRDLTLEEQAHSFNFDHPTVSSIPHLCHAKLIRHGFASDVTVCCLLHAHK